MKRFTAEARAERARQQDVTQPVMMVYVGLVGGFTWLSLIIAVGWFSWLIFWMLNCWLNLGYYC